MFPFFRSRLEKAGSVKARYWGEEHYSIGNP